MLRENDSRKDTHKIFATNTYYTGKLDKTHIGMKIGSYFHLQYMELKESSLYSQRIEYELDLLESFSLHSSHFWRENFSLAD